MNRAAAPHARKTFPERPEDNMARIYGALSLVLAAVALSPTASLAQSYPSKPIRIIVPFAAGGAVDVVARLVGGKISENIGQTVIIENRPGASGTLGADAVAKSPPDGYTILQNSQGQALAPALFRTLPFDTLNDFVPVTEVVRTQSVLVIYPKLPVTTLKELIALAKAKPDSLNYGVTGLGNASNLNIEMMKRVAGIELQAIPYKGDAPLNTDLIAGQIHIAIVPLATAKPLIDNGQLRALAVIGPGRSPILPDVPTAAEALPPGFGTTGWQGWFVAGKTPRETVAKIQAEVARALTSPEVISGIKALGNEPVGSTPDEFGVRFRDDVVTLQKIVDDAQIPKLN
jgi:tripartite-type tricarboxylate transporter receptor subunit TctC